MTQKSKKPRPMVILLSALLGVEVDYHDKVHAENFDIWEKYDDSQIAKAQILYSTLLRKKIKDKIVRAAFAEEKFLVEVKTVKDRETKEEKEKKVFLQDLVIFSNPVFSDINKAIMREVMAEVPFNKTSTKRGPGAKASSAISIKSGLDNLDYDEFTAKSEETAETLEAWSKRGKALGKGKKKEPEKAPEKPSLEEMPGTGNATAKGRKVTGGTKTKNAPVYETEPAEEKESNNPFSERLEVIEKLKVRIEKVSKIADPDDDDDEATILLSKLQKKLKRLEAELEEMQAALADDDDSDSDYDDDSDYDSDSDFSDLDNDDDDDDAPVEKPKPEPKKASKPKPEPKPEPKKPNIQPEKVRRSRPKL